MSGRGRVEREAFGEGSIHGKGNYVKKWMDIGQSNSHSSQWNLINFITPYPD